MLESNNLVTFEGLANSSAYHTFLLDEEKGRLVVGAKDHIFSFNLLNISKDYAQVKTMFDFPSVCLVVLNIHPSMTVSLFALLTNLIPALSVCIFIQSASQGLRYLGTLFSVSTGKCFMNISDQYCRTRSHAVPGMLAALCSPG